MFVLHTLVVCQTHSGLNMNECMVVIVASYTWESLLTLLRWSYQEPLLKLQALLSTQPFRHNAHHGEQKNDQRHELRSSPNLGFGTQQCPVRLRKLTVEHCTLCKFLA
jgi:hypothetical protein